MKRLPISIAGGGLAGLTLGIGLRQQGIPVTIREKASYPRHRVCGEFISGRGQQVLKALGLQDEFLAAGAGSASSALFAFGKRTSRKFSVQPEAICLSRFRLDALMARHFRDLGGELLEHATVTEGYSTPGTIQATGRARSVSERGWRWFGLKAHATSIDLHADLEMHCFPHGYIGLTRIEQGKVNVCGLFRRKAISHTVDAMESDWKDRLLGPAGSNLRERLKSARFEPESFCAVAALPLSPRRAAGRKECCLGDALTMIPPVTGNGMSMAVEAAAASLEPLIAYSRGALSWEQARAVIAHRCDQLFASRLRWAGLVQQVLFMRGPSSWLAFRLLNIESTWKRLFLSTR